MYGNKITDESKDLIGNRGSKTPQVALNQYGGKIYSFGNFDI